MKLWQLRLGENGQKIQDWREVFLADKHSLIAIDYRIQTDITNMTCQQIKSYIKSINVSLHTKTRAVTSYANQIINFNKHIKIGDYFISPINYLDINKNSIAGGRQKNYRIGEIVSDVGNLESLFQGNLAPYLPNNAHSRNLQKYMNINECRYFPTREVKWLTEIFPDTNLIDIIYDKKSNGSRIGTVAELKFFTGQLPQGLVKNINNITWTP